MIIAFDSPAFFFRPEGHNQNNKHIAASHSG